MIRMSYRDEAREKRAGQFRTTMDIVMGIFYIAVGLVLLITRGFVGVPLPAVVAYILGAMMTLGGMARFYRGIKAVLPKKNNSNTSGIE
jgi:hypothetical protein